MSVSTPTTRPIFVPDLLTAQTALVTGGGTGLGRASVEALAATAAERVAQIDILVNNAEGQFPQRARDIPPRGWHAVIETNLYGTWNMTQVFGNQAREGKGGVITQIIAVVGRAFPGPVNTRGFDETYDLDVMPGLRKIPIPRFGRPQEVANATLFSSSPGATYITGEVLYVAGGQQLCGSNQAIGEEQFEPKE